MPDAESLPKALDVAVGYASEDSLEGLTSRVANSMFTVGWLSEIADDHLGRSMTRLAVLQGREVGDGGLFDPFTDVAPGGAQKGARNARAHFLEDLREDRFQDDVGKAAEALLLRKAAEVDPDKVFLELRSLQGELLDAGPSGFLATLDGTELQRFSAEFAAPRSSAVADSRFPASQQFLSSVPLADRERDGIERECILTGPFITPAGHYLAISARSDFSSWFPLDGYRISGSDLPAPPPPDEPDDGPMI